MLNDPNTRLQPWTPEQLQQIKDAALKLAPFIIITPIVLVILFKFLQE